MKVEIYTSKRLELRRAVTNQRLDILKIMVSQTSDKYIIGQLQAIAQSLVSARKPEGITPKRYKDKEAKRSSVQSKTLKSAVNFKQAWTNKDDEIVFTSCETDEQIAIRLGRSFSSIGRRRGKLRALMTPNV